MKISLKSSSSRFFGQCQTHCKLAFGAIFCWVAKPHKLSLILPMLQLSSRHAPTYSFMMELNFGGGRSIWRCLCRSWPLGVVITWWSAPAAAPDTIWWVTPFRPDGLLRPAGCSDPVPVGSCRLPGVPTVPVPAPLAPLVAGIAGCVDPGGTRSVRGPAGTGFVSRWKSSSSTDTTGPVISCISDLSKDIFEVFKYFFSILHILLFVIHWIIWIWLLILSST